MQSKPGSATTHNVYSTSIVTFPNPSLSRRSGAQVRCQRGRVTMESSFCTPVYHAHRPSCPAQMGSLFGTPPFETATSLLNPNSKPDSHAWPTPSPPWTAAADVIVAFVCHGPSLYLRTPSTGSWLRIDGRKPFLPSAMLRQQDLMARPKAIFHNASVSTLVNLSSKQGVARVLVGIEQREFRVNKKLLSATSQFFRDQLDATPAGILQLSLVQKSVPVWLPQQTSSTPIQLLDESPAMFELFTVWLHQRDAFRRHLDDMIAMVSDAPEETSECFHWALVNLHIFAAKHDLDQLQDMAIDALQDLYLRCDWDVTPEFVTFLFGERGARTTMRLRRWATAMVAWSIAGGPCHPRDQDANCLFEPLLKQFSDFNAEYVLHVAKLNKGKLDARIKNPQLRIPANKLRNDERQFGFRQCSFHTHRAAVGERRCPHAATSMELDNYPMLVPLIIDIVPYKSSRFVKHVKSPSCPAAPLRHYEYPAEVPMPLQAARPLANAAVAG
ncbi:hypothetical protein VDGE_03074 [Verticillium dahliae]|nr:hypothetical protein VDGE_03074 [Verticillium dahliae]